MRHWAEGYYPIKGAPFYPYGKSKTIKINRQTYNFLKRFNKGFWCYNISLLEREFSLLRIICQEFPFLH